MDIHTTNRLAQLEVGLKGALTYLGSTDGTEQCVLGCVGRGNELHRRDLVAATTKQERAQRVGHGRSHLAPQMR